MTACTVTCRDCEDPPKVWNHLCTDCADDQLQAHRMETGHDPILHIPTEVTWAEIRRDMAAASRLMGRRKC
jgi:hypothetical protein